jgi:hypothetical protein
MIRNARHILSIIERTVLLSSILSPSFMSPAGLPMDPKNKTTYSMSAFKLTLQSSRTLSYRNSGTGTTWSTTSLALLSLIPPALPSGIAGISYVLNAVSEDLRDLLNDPSFMSSISAPTLSAEDGECQEGNHPLSLLLLSAMPDFLLVLSLKGLFLYMAPPISRHCNILLKIWLVDPSLSTATLWTSFP